MVIRGIGFGYPPDCYGSRSVLPTGGRSKDAAELERTLEVFWRRKLNLNDLSANDLRKTLREHPQAQEMLEQFDLWLYRPGETGNVDIDELLSPYQSLSTDELQR